MQTHQEKSDQKIIAKIEHLQKERDALRKITEVMQNEALYEHLSVDELEAAIGYRFRQMKDIYLTASVCDEDFIFQDRAAWNLFSMLDDLMDEIHFFHDVLLGRFKKQINELQAQLNAKNNSN